MLVPSLIAFALIAIRIAAFVLSSAVLRPSGLPALASVVFVISLAYLFLDAGYTPAVTQSMGVIGFVLMAAVESINGIAMGFAIRCATAAFQFAARLLDIQMGFGLSSVFDPSSNTTLPALATGINMLGVLLFFALGGDKAIMQGLAFSFEQAPLGVPLTGLRPEPLIRQFGAMFTMGLLLCAPIAIVLLLLDMALAVTSRALPQVNVFVLSLQLKAAVGLLALAIVLPFWPDSASRIYAQALSSWSEVLR